MSNAERCARYRAKRGPWKYFVRKYKYGLNEEDFQVLMKKQDSRCAICNEIMGKPQVDHDHSCCSGRKSCGKCIRELLCHKCNTGLGCFLDNEALLLKSVAYLQKHKRECTSTQQV